MKRLGIGLRMVKHKGASPANQAPLINDQTFAVAENSANGTVVGTVAATDPDNDTLFFAIFSGNDFDIFAINEDTGQLTIADNTHLNFENYPQHTLVIRVSDGTTSSDGNITVNVTDVYEMFQDVELIGHYIGIQQKSDGYYFIDQIPTGGVHTKYDAKLVQSNAIQFNKTNSRIDGTAVCRIVTPADAEPTPNTYIFRHLIRIDDLAQANKYVWQQNTSGVTGFRFFVNGNKWKVQIKDSWGDAEQTFESAVTIPDTTNYYWLDVTVVKYGYNYRAGNRIKIDYNAATQESFNISASNGPIANTGGIIGDATTGNAAKMSLAHQSVWKNGVKVYEVNMAQEHFANFADPNSAINDYNVYDSVSGSLLTGRLLSPLQDNDILPSNILGGYQLFEGYSGTAIGTYWKVPYKSDSTRIFTSPSTTPGANIALYTWIGDFPAGDGHNFAETKIKLGTGNIVSIHDICNISTEKYFIAPYTTELVHEFIAYSAVKKDFEMQSILTYLGLTDYNGYYGIEYDTIEVVNSAVTRVYQEGYEFIHYYLPVQRAMKACLINEGVVTYLDPHDHTKLASGAASALDGSMGDYMVEIPDFYFKTEVYGNTNRVYISLVEFSESILVPKMYISAVNAVKNHTTNLLYSIINTASTYRGGDHGNPALENWRADRSSFDAGNNSLLGLPVAKYSAKEFQDMAASKGDGWFIEHISARTMLTWLMVIEFGDRNLQKTASPKFNGFGQNQGGLGRGATNFIDTASNPDTAISAFYPGISPDACLPFVPNGASKSLGNFSGEVLYTKTGYNGGVANVINVNRYRGIELPGWGDLLYQVAGVVLKHEPPTTEPAFNGSITGYVFDDPSLIKFIDDYPDTEQGRSDFMAYVIANARQLDHLLPIVIDTHDFNPITNIQFGSKGDIIAKSIVNTSGSKENITSFGDRYHDGLSGSGAVSLKTIDDRICSNMWGNDIIACGLYGMSAGPFMQWAGESYKMRKVNLGTKLVFIPSFQ